MNKPKVVLGVNVDKEVLTAIKSARGGIPRSTFVNKILRRALDLEVKFHPPKYPNYYDVGKSKN